MRPNRCAKPMLDPFVCGLDANHEGDCGAPWKPWKRANYVPAPAYYNLNQACTIVNRALGGFGCYHVGSSLERKDWRDIDVRFIMSDEEYDYMFRDKGENGGGWLNPYWSLLCTLISSWLSQQCGLPVDFQIQRQTQANAEHDGKRCALGIFHDYPGERPSDLKPDSPTVPAPEVHP